jgi:hypothetical protein
MSELIVTNVNLPMAIRWWAKVYGKICTYHQANGNFLITMDMDRDREHFHTVINLNGYLPDNLEIALDISDLAAPVQEALVDCFNQTVIEVEDLEMVYDYDS